MIDILALLFSCQDRKKLHGQLITEQEALYGSKPSPNKSGKKPLRTPVIAAMNRKLSLGGAMLQSSKPDKATLSSKRTNFYDQNANSRRDSTIPTPSGNINNLITKESGLQRPKESDLFMSIYV